MKKSVCLLMFLVMLMTCTVFAESGSSIVDRGTCGEKLTWILTEDGTLTISGQGEMEAYDQNPRAYTSTSPWFQYNSEIKNVVIEAGVTTVGESAFAHCYNIVKATLPQGLTLIDSAAFLDCSSLVFVAFPDSLMTIGSSAFYGCSLSKIAFPAGIRKIGTGSFETCHALKSATIMNSDVEIEGYAFDSGSESLTIYAPAGSTAEVYCANYRIKFEKLDESWTCSGCNTKMSFGNYCYQCGRKRPAEQTCTGCGFVNTPGVTMKYCPMCGTKFK